MTIKDSKLRDLFDRYMNFVNANYVRAIINETTNTVSISYVGELSRIILKVRPDIKSIVAKITQDPTQKMSDTNGKIYYMSSIDEMDQLIAATKVIMDLRISSGASAAPRVKTEAEDGQGYLYDKDKKLIGVVDLRLIPTNSFIYDTDLINEEIHEEHEKKEDDAPGFKRTLMKFFS